MNSQPFKNEDKNNWCDIGQKAEGDFVASAQIDGWGISWNPQKYQDQYTHDLMGIIPMDLKTIRTPWRLSQSLFGIPPERAVSVNVKDFLRYHTLYPNIIILLDVIFLNEVYMLTLSRAKALIECGKAKRHEYKNRVDDTLGNGKASFIFDLNDLDKLNT
jgi:hypothetical protein